MENKRIDLNSWWQKIRSLDYFAIFHRLNCVIGAVPVMFCGLASYCALIDGYKSFYFFYSERLHIYNPPHTFWYFLSEEGFHNYWSYFTWMTAELFVYIALYRWLENKDKDSVPLNLSLGLLFFFVTFFAHAALLYEASCTGYLFFPVAGTIPLITYFVLYILRAIKAIIDGRRDSKKLK